MLDAIAAKFGKPDKQLSGNDKDTGPYSCDTYVNGDIEAQVFSITSQCSVAVHGVDAFLKNCSDKAFAARAAIDKTNKAKQHKNL